jgi:hypothetical protein
MITPESEKFGVDCNGVMAMSFGMFSFRGKSTQTLPEITTTWPISRMGPSAQLGHVVHTNVSRSAPLSPGVTKPRCTKQPPTQHPTG